MKSLLDELRELQNRGPSGTVELMLCMATPSPRGAQGIPALVWGAPGTGKSSFVEAFARDDLPVFTLIASIHDPTDFSGFPMLDKETGSMQFAPPGWLRHFEPTGRGILFLDELTTAPPSVQAALLRLVLERRVGSYALPEGVVIVAAGNPPEQMAAGWELSAPLANRFAHVYWEYPTLAYAEALAVDFPRVSLPSIPRDTHSRILPSWRLTIARFLQHAGSEYLCTEPDEDRYPYAFASPRTWEYAAYLLTTASVLSLIPLPGQADWEANGKPRQAVWNLIEGTVGLAAARAFRAFVEELRIPDPQRVLVDRHEFDPVKLREDEHWIFWSGCAAVLSRLHETARHSRQPEDIDTLIEAILRYADLCAHTADADRADVVVPSLRRLAKTGFFSNVVQLVPDESRRRELAGSLATKLGGTELASILRELDEFFDRDRQAT